MEMVARAVTDLAKVIDPGDIDGILPGDKIKITLAKAINEGRVPPNLAVGLKLKKQYDNFPKGTVVTEEIAQQLSRYPEIEVEVNKKIKYEPYLASIKTLPLETQEDWAAAGNFEKLKQTFENAINTMQGAVIHGFSPITGLMVGSTFNRADKSKYPEGSY